MAEGSSEYKVILKTAIEEIKQAQINEAGKNVKLNIPTSGTDTLKNNFKDVEKTNKNIFNTLKDNAGKVAQWALSTGIVYGTLDQIRRGMEYIVDLNKEMTNIQIVTGMSSAQIDALAASYTDLAKEFGVTTLEVAKGSLEWKIGRAHV
jgi:hypothetical protein